MLSLQKHFKVFVLHELFKGYYFGLFSAYHGCESVVRFFYLKWINSWKSGKNDLFLSLFTIPL